MISVRDDTQIDLLFASLAEQIKLPLVQIRHAAELISADASVQADVIDATARAGLHLIDGYLLSVRLQAEGQLQLEPVSISSLLYDTADKLQPYAKLHNCEIELNIAGKYVPVMAERRVLSSALLALGYGFIGASSRDSGPVSLAVKRSVGGISAGVYSSNNGLGSELIKQARRLGGRAHQALPGFSSDSGAGILIADRLLTQIDTVMRPTRMQGLSGLGVTLSPSRQLSLV